jgi:hypothetical protein
MGASRLWQARRRHSLPPLLPRSSPSSVGAPLFDRLRHGRLRHGYVDLPLGPRSTAANVVGAGPRSRRRGDAAVVEGLRPSGRGWGLLRPSGLMGLTGRRALACLGSGQHDTRGVSVVPGPPPRPGGPTRPDTKVHRACVVPSCVGLGQIGLGPGDSFGHL